mgnify:CR=1 FL=1
MGSEMCIRDSHYGATRAMLSFYDTTGTPCKLWIEMTSDSVPISSFPEKHFYSGRILSFEDEILSHPSFLGMDSVSAIRFFTESIQPLVFGGDAIDDMSTTIASAMDVVAEDSLCFQFFGYRKEDQVFGGSFSIPIGARIGIGGNITFGGSIVYTNTLFYTKESGVVTSLERKVFPLEEYEKDYFVDSGTDFLYVAENILDGAISLITDALSEALSIVYEVVESGIETVVSWISSVLDEGAEVIAETGSFFEGYIIRIISFGSIFDFKTADGEIITFPYQTRAIPSRLVKSFDTDSTSVVTAVGRSYWVEVLRTDSTCVDTFTTPITMKIWVDDSSLIMAGYTPSDYSQLSIYHWDNVNDSIKLAVQLPTTFVGDTLQAQINEPGCYFAGIYDKPPDRTPPYINEIFYETDDSSSDTTVTIYFIVSDDSEIDPNSVLFTINEDTINGSVNLSSDYGLDQRIISYTLSTETYTDSCYTGYFYVADYAGNYSDTMDTYCFPLKVEEHSKPEKFYLFQNYPNPFNERTAICFILPEKSPVRLDIYDISGKLVYSEYRAELNAGIRHFYWNGVNSSGNKVPSGTYFYRIQYADNVSTVRKMILTR